MCLANRVFEGVGTVAARAMAAPLFSFFLLLFLSRRIEWQTLNLQFWDAGRPQHACAWQSVVHSTWSRSLTTPLASSILSLVPRLLYPEYESQNFSTLCAGPLHSCWASNALGVSMNTAGTQWYIEKQPTFALFTSALKARSIPSTSREFLATAIQTGVVPFCK